MAHALRPAPPPRLTARPHRARALALAALAAPLAVTLAVTLAAAPIVAQEVARAEPGADSVAARPAAPLFATADPLLFELRADFKTVFRDRDTLSTKRYPATLSLAAADGRPVTLRVQIAPRGHFRLQPRICGFPPIRVVLPKGETGDTPFAGQRSLKLATHCRDGNDEYEQYVLREYLVYRTLNLLTDRSFRARLARVTYVEERDTTSRRTAYAFFVENEDHVAKRNGGKVVELKGAQHADLDPEQTRLVALFQYFVGNTDFSLSFLHNIRLVSEGYNYYPVPYDFDWSGVVSTDYARPDARLPIRSVRERTYRGPCMTREEFAPLFDRFVARRADIYALYDGLADLDPGYRRRAREYYEEFYEELGGGWEAWKSVQRGCETRGSTD
jgi:hypothetical protein